MNTKRAVITAVLLYCATFAVGIIAGLMTGTDFEGGAPIALEHWFITIIFSALVTIPFVHWYFKDVDEVSAIEGIKLGLTFLGVGVIADAILVVPYMLTTGAGPDAVASYYNDPLFYVAVIVIVFIPVIMGDLKQTKASKVKKLLQRK